MSADRAKTVYVYQGKAYPSVSMIIRHELRSPGLIAWGRKVATGKEKR